MPKHSTTDDHRPQDWQKKILAESKGSLRFSLTNDYMFKAICQSNKYALKGLLSALLGVQLEEILDIEVMNPIQLGSAVNEKDCILDVKLLLNSNRIINLELQVVFQSDWVDRSLVYLCRGVSGQLRPGEPYGNILDTMHIGIVDFNLFKDNKEFHSLYYLTNTKTGHIYTGKFSLAVVNLRQIEHATKEDVASGLKDWAKLFRATTWEELTMIAKENETMTSFTFSLKELTEDEKIQMQCEARERYEHDRASLFCTGFDEGVEVGMQRGLEQGLQQSQARIEAAEARAAAAEAELYRLKMN